jgi:preprotein translocase subunit SecG
LFSFLHSDDFNKVIRNSGFIISTIMLKLSFGAEGILNSFLIVCAVLFGVIILKIHNLYEKKNSLN